jgi:phosphoribosylamine---glycine ligase
VRGVAAEGHPYTGFLYAGLMITADGTPKVLEYNCRFGDPEAQPVLLRLKSDLVALISAALRGQLDKMTIDWDPRVALGVVMASGGYPGSYSKGHIITGLGSNGDDSQKVFHAGTIDRDGQIVTEGGRVLCATALGKTVTSAQAKAYELAQRINWKDVYYRRDIGYRAIARESTT